MTDDRDSLLQELFDVANQVELDHAFTARVQAAIDAQRRNALIGWGLAALLLVIVGWLLFRPLQEAVFGITQLLPTQLIDLDDDLVSQVLAPINSIAAIVAIAYFGVRSLLKNIKT